MKNHKALANLPELISKVEEELLKRVPDRDCHYTVDILLWTDDSYRVEARHGNDDGYIYSVIIHDEEMTYEKIPLFANRMSKDAEGNMFYVLSPEEIEQRKLKIVDEVIIN